MQVSALGALIGLLLSIILIIKKNNPAYSLILGAFIGGISGGVAITDTVNMMIAGARGITPAVLRILTAGILAGVLIESGAAGKIAESIIEKVGEKRALLALALAAMILTAIGVFVDVAVITVSSIALALAKRINLSKLSILLAMSGGAKCGNIISPNPNTIAAAQNFNVELSSLMAVNIIPAIIGLIFTVVLSKYLANKGEGISEIDDLEIEKEQPSFIAAIVGPVVTIALLILRPLCGISVDPLIALPAGGIIACAAMGRLNHLKMYMQYGLDKMTGVAILLMGTGTVAGIIENSTLKGLISNSLQNAGLPEFILAPISGILMAGATASTAAGVSVASATFATTITGNGVNPLYAAAMLHAGGTVLSQFPHGSFFHSSAGSTNMGLQERFKLIPYEGFIGLLLTLASVGVYLITKNFA